MWTTFLTAFDEGVITDLMGNKANLKDAIICMTTNLGSSAFYDPELSTPEQQTAAVVAAIKQTMPPEFLNRVDELIVFHPFDYETFVELAAREVELVKQRFAAKGRTIEVEPGVVEAIAITAYSNEFGARNLSRVVAELISEPAAKEEPGLHRFGIVNGGVRLIEG